MKPSLARRFRIPLAAALALGAILPHATEASVDAKSKLVLERYLKASGGREAWDKDATTHSKISVSAFNLQGRVDHWTARPDRSVQATRLGPLNIFEGTIGEKAWRVDQNGKLQWLDGKELEEARATVYLDQEMWLAPDQGGGRVRYLERETEDGKTLDVLEVTPPVGKPRKLAFDSQSGLLAKIIQQNDQEEVVTHLSDYRQEAGRQRAGTMLTQMKGAPANDLHAALDSIAVAVPVDEKLFLPPQAGAQDFRFLNGGTSTKLPMRYGERHVWLKVSVNGQPAEDFLLDTGASVTVLDSAYAAKLGLTSQGSLQGAGAGQQGNFSFTKVNSLRAEGTNGEGVEMSQHTVVIAPLSQFLSRYFWRDTPGVLGYDFLSRFVVTIDYQNQTLELSQPDAFTYKGKGTAVPLTFSGGVPVVHAKLDRYEGDFRLDVGSGSSVDLHTPFVADNHLKEKISKTVSSPAVGFGGRLEMATGRMKTFTIGPYTVKEPLVGLSGATTGAFASEDYAGNVGNRILDRFRVIFDYGRKTVYLEPNSRLGERDEFGKFGAQLLKDGERVSVGYVAPGSPADKAGLREGDHVRSIDGKDAGSYSPDVLVDLFEDKPEGTRVNVEVDRGGEPKKVEVTLRAMI